MNIKKNRITVDYLRCDIIKTRKILNRRSKFLNLENIICNKI